MSTFEYHQTTGASKFDPLNQSNLYAFKGIFGAKVLSLAETVVAGTNAAATDRVMSISVMSGALTHRLASSGAYQIVITGQGHDNTVSGRVVIRPA